MPNYDFKCTKCGYKFTKLVPMDKRNKVKCEICGEKAEQLFSWGGNFSIGSSGKGDLCKTSRFT